MHAYNLKPTAGLAPLLPRLYLPLSNASIVSILSSCKYCSESKSRRTTSGEKVFDEKKASEKKASECLAREARGEAARRCVCCVALYPARGGDGRRICNASRVVARCAAARGCAAVGGAGVEVACASPLVAICVGGAAALAIPVMAATPSLTSRLRCSASSQVEVRRLSGELKALGERRDGEQVRRK
jgi:hypothetical protein